jgi:hypothetical protein
MKSIVFFIGILLLSHTEAYSTQADSIVVLPVKMKVPDGANKLGSFTLGNNATETNCDYEALIRAAKEKAGTMGGNMVKITELIDPAFISKCYKIKADVYHVAQLPQYKLTTTDAPLNANYATLYFYRLKDTMAFVTAYNVHMNGDSIVCKVKSRSRDSVNVYSDGPVTLWAATERRTELKIDVKTGNKYYIRCGLRKGEIRMVPVLELVNNEMGKTEYEQERNHKKNMGVEYLQQVH